jgi:hypothetical protein
MPHVLRKRLNNERTELPVGSAPDDESLKSRDKLVQLRCPRQFGRMPLGVRRLGGWRAFVAPRAVVSMRSEPVNRRQSFPSDQRSAPTRVRQSLTDSLVGIRKR